MPESEHPFVPGENVVQANLQYQLYGQVCENTLYFECLTSPVTVTDAETLAEALDDWWHAHLRAAISNSALLFNIHLVDLTSQDSFSYDRTVASPQAGSYSSPAAPGNVAFCITFKTARRGRSFTGRNYVPAVPDDIITGNTVDVDYASGVSSAYNNLLAAATSAGFTWGVFSRMHAKAWRTAGVFEPIITVLNINTDLDSQRRRLNGRGI